MASNLKLFVSDEGTSPSALPVAEVRRALAAGEVGPGARFRADLKHPWLPGAAWEALADLVPAPRPPAAPTGGIENALPTALAEVPPIIREKLLWFVADEDGVMGPVSGDFVARGLREGKIPLSAAVSLASWSARVTWVRAPLVFPTATVGSTTIRKRPLTLSACAYCLEPLGPADALCPTCGESTQPGSGALARTLVAASAIVLVAAIAFTGALLARRAGVLAPSPPPATAQPESPQPPASAAASARAEPRTRHLLTGVVVAKADVARDAADAIALADDRIAVATPAGLEVLDARTGALLFAAPELAGARSLHAAGDVVYAAMDSRIAAVDAGAARAVAFLGRDAPPGAGPAKPAKPEDPPEIGWALPFARERRVALLPGPERRGILVVDASRHALIARVALGEVIASAAIDDRGDAALAAGARLLFALAPSATLPPPDEGAASAGRAVGASAVGVRRVDLGDAPAAVAVAGDGAFGVAVLRKRAELARIDLGPRSALAPPGARVKTCADPVGVVIGAGVAIVACGSAKAAWLHDGATLERVAAIELAGPAIGIELAPDRTQALIAVGGGAPGVAVVDLARREAKAVATGEPIASARYGVGGRVATALAPRTQKLLVIR